MANYQLLKTDIDAKVYQNGAQEISGANLNAVLNAMVASLGVGYQFMGMATPTNPGTEQTPDYKCFYIATTPGKYTNLGGVVVADGEVAILKWDSAWTKVVTGVAKSVDVNNISKGLTYMSDTAYINIDLINKKIVTGGISSTPGYIAVGNGEWKKIGLGETEFVVKENATGIYFLFLDGNNNNLVTLVDYTRVGNYDWRNCVVLGLIAISGVGNPPTIVGDNLPFAHQVNGAWVNKAQKNALQGKKITIFGDSISTYAGYIPSENATFFPRAGYDVNDVSFTWWKKLLDATGMILEINNSWSGSRIATPPAGRTEKAFTNPDRYNNLGNPDIIIVFGGINDEFAQSDPTTPGEFNLSTTGNMDVTQFKQAYQFLVRTLQTNYPNAKLFICTPTFKGASGIFENNDVGINQYEFHNVIRQIADMYGCGFIDLAKCGINVYNYQTYLDDTVHPNRKGMQLIFEKVMGALNSYYNGNTGVNV